MTLLLVQLVPLTLPRAAPRKPAPAAALDFVTKCVAHATAVIARRNAPLTGAPLSLAAACFDPTVGWCKLNPIFEGACFQCLELTSEDMPAFENVFFGHLNSRRFG
jgi:hypothetical protein